MRRPFAVGIMLIALVMVAAACSHNRERVLLPPRANVEGIETIAVLPLRNVSEDPGLALELEEGIAGALREHYRVIDRGRVTTALAEAGIAVEHLGSPEVALTIAHSLGVDAVITGAVTYYFEDVSVDTPTRTSSGPSPGAYHWHTHRRTIIMVTMTGQLLRADTGDVVYSRRADGEHTAATRINISWNREEPPPEVLIPQASRQEVPSSRGRAISRTTDAFTADLLPSFVWVRVED